MSQTREAVEAMIAQQQARWAAMSPDEKLESLRAEQLASAAREADAARLTAEKFEAVIAAFRDRASGVQPMTREQEEELNWRTRIAPDMRAAGVEARDIRQLAPDWNCKPQEGVFKLVRSLCRRTGAVVALVGQRGSGKTTLATQLMLERIRASWAYSMRDADKPAPPPPLGAGRYAKLGSLAAQFKPLYADFGSLGVEALSDRLLNWCKIDLLILDEIHESEDLKTQMRLLVDLVDRRYAAKRDTILISNHDADQFQKEMNPSIISRIGEHGKIIPCNWKSWRAQA